MRYLRNTANTALPNLRYTANTAIPQCDITAKYRKYRKYRGMRYLRYSSPVKGGKYRTRSVVAVRVRYFYRYRKYRGMRYLRYTVTSLLSKNKPPWGFIRGFTVLLKSNTITTPLSPKKLAKYLTSLNVVWYNG